MAGFAPEVLDLLRKLGGAGGFSVGAGDVYWVKVGGDDTADGRDPNHPLATRAAAYAKCVSGHNDYIIDMGPSITGLVAASPTLVIAKDMVHLIGLGHGGWDSGIDINGGTVPVIQIGDWTGINFELAGFNLGGGTADAIEAIANAYKAHIHHCSFGEHYASVDAITAVGGIGDYTHSKIDHCVFGPMLTGDAFDVGSSTTEFSNNRFHRVQGRCLYLANPTNCEIFRNRFFSRQSVGLAAGWAVHLVVGQGSLVSHNWAAQAANDAGNNPYRDSSGPAVGTVLHGWADNYDGPALSAAPDVP